MTAAHVFYIPVIAIAGLVLGFIWGRTAALREVEAKARRQEELDARRKARREKRRQKSAGADES